MNIRSASEDQAFKDFSALCRTVFSAALNELREIGQKQNISADAICVAIAVATIRSQALCCVGGRFPASNFDGLLAEEIDRVKKGLALRRKPQ